MQKPRLLIFLILFSLFGKVVRAEVPVLPSAKKGILDLRNTTLSQIPAPIKGEWAFYWKQLYSFNQPPAAVPEYIPYPSLWKEIVYKGQTLPSTGYCTYELTVLFPHNRPLMALEVPDMYSSYALYINDSLVLSNGHPDTTAETSTPFWNTSVIRLSPESDSFHIYLQIANYWHHKGGSHQYILMGGIRQIIQKKDQEMAFDLILTGCLFMGGLFFLGLYFFGRRDHALLYFSLFCILYSYRMIGTERYVLHTLLPNLSWFLTIKLEYFSLSMGVGIFTWYTRLLFPEDTNKRMAQFIVGFCVTYSIIILVTPPQVFTALLNVFLASSFVFAGYSGYVYIQAALNKRTGSVYALLGIALMMLIFIATDLKFFDLLPIPPFKGITFCCYIAFFFLQSLALSHRFASSFRTATREAQQGLKIKSEFLSTMSHEIRTPLNAVIGMTHVLLQKNPRTDQQEPLDVLLFSANNLLSIVNNILDYSKIEAGKISFENIPMDIRAIATNITLGLKSSVIEKDISLRLEIDPRLTGKVMGDPTRFSQVINNLVQNAIKFTKEGWVCLRLDVAAIDEHQVTVNISVEDTGIGIERDKLGLIFERFSQAESSTSRSYGGTGLGLAICKKILQLQGSELRVKSTPHVGSCFYFTQTFVLNHDKTPVIKEDKKHERLVGVNILLVEDHPFNVVLAQTILQGWGAEIEVATNGAEALNMLDSTRHHIVLMDLHMPVMDGYEATERLRARGEKLPIIALTANTPGELEKGLLDTGLTDILVKPFNPDDLYRVIIKHLPENIN